MKWFLILSGILFILIAAYYLFLTRSTPHLAARTLTVGSHEIAVEVVDTMAARTQGLSGRDGLADGHGMLFVFGTPGKYGFWMKDMKFALDFVWIRGDRVIGVTENVSPQPHAAIFNLTNYYPPEPADRILEIPAGAVRNYGITVGDKVRIAL